MVALIGRFLTLHVPEVLWPLLRFGLPVAVCFAFIVLVGVIPALVFAALAVLVWSV